MIAIKGTTTDALETTAEPILESGGKAESDVITDSMDHWTGNVLIYQAASDETYHQNNSSSWLPLELRYFKMKLGNRFLKTGDEID